MPGQKNKKLENIRKALGLTLENFSKELGIPLGTYKKYEYNERPQPFWLPILIERLEYKTLLKNKKIDIISDRLIVIFMAFGWDTCDIKKFVRKMLERL